MKISYKGQVIGIPIRSITYPLDQRSPIADQTNATTIHDPFPDDRSSTLKRSSRVLHSVLNRMNKLSKKAHDSFAHGIKEHVKLRPKITRILQFGGVEKLFKQLFCVSEGEKLIKASGCYLWTTAGPIAGLLFISTEKISFCSQKSIKLSSSNEKFIRARYKVVVPISKIQNIEQSENVSKPTQKYIELVTVDNFDFWFTGFFNYQKAFNYLQQSVSQS